MTTLENLHFDDSYRRLPGEFFAEVLPQGLREAHAISVNEQAARLLDLDPQALHTPRTAEYFGGHRLLPCSKPVAMVYSGHQFGVYVPRLGDGRALLLGEVRNRNGQKWDLHLKGSGKTPFSRQGDGRAVLRSTIREYLCSEAMHGLGIPTSRALCIIGSSEPVYREQVESGATLLRLAESHVRFGSFEYFHYTRRFEALRQLADYVIDGHFPQLAKQKERYTLFFRQVVHANARLIAHWQAAGFAHGVMNTDNMSILGHTLDYGPFGFLDDFDASFICNHSDHQGRYAFDQQPGIGWWNCTALGEALSSLVPEEERRRVLEEYPPVFQTQLLQLARAKMGLFTEQEEDGALFAELLALLHHNRADYTNFFRALADFAPEETAAPGNGAPPQQTGGTSDGNGSIAAMLAARPSARDAWLQRYTARLRGENRPAAERRGVMRAANPRYVLRNYLAQQAIHKATEEKDYTMIDALLQLLRAPFDDHPGQEHYAQAPPSWGKSLEISCSS